ncbi:NAD(P)-binding protein [Cadophora sp. DSE1049]|nr:NAD(P)-binding protein [Cadophora sp. DSE1049]
MTRWSFSSTGDEVVSTFTDRVQGKTILITGPSTGGIGAQTALTLSSGQPSHLILTGRSLPKIQPVISAINAAHPTVKTTFIPCDLSSQSSARAAAKEINALVEKIDILICNAAIMACPYVNSVDGIESQFATNHVGHFLLVNLLRGKLRVRGTRVVVVGSSAHAHGGVRFEDWNFEDGKSYNEWEAYGQSKTANMLFAKALARKMEKSGGFAFSLNPGFHMLSNEAILADGLARMTASEAKEGRVFVRAPQKTLPQGCATTLIAALDPELEPFSGEYLDDGDVSKVKVREYATSLENQEKLWKLSEELVGEEFVW